MKKMLGERWKPIFGYEGLYEISNLGRVYSIPRLVRVVPKKVETTRSGVGGYFLKPDTSHFGYHSVNLQKNGKGKFLLVHRIVALHFIKNPENKPQVNHKNFDRADNNYKNLEFVTNKENWHHAFKHKMMDKDRNWIFKKDFIKC